MLPDRKEWFNNFIKSDRYKHIIKQIDNYPVPDYVPGWNGQTTWQDADARYVMYMRRTISLSSIYPIDYINNQTNGGLITNVTDRHNYFAGMYNIQLPDGSKTFNNTNPQPFTDLMYFYKQQFDNVISVCTLTDFSLSRIDYIIKNLSTMISKTPNGGFGYLSLNIMRMMPATLKTDIEKYELEKYYRLVDYVDDQVEEATKNLNVLYYENLFDSPTHDDPIDGTLRLFFKTKPSTKV